MLTINKNPDIIQAAQSIRQGRVFRRNGTARWYFYASAFIPEQMKLVTLEDDGVVVGWVGLFKCYEREVWEIQTFVKVRYRRQGWATKMYNAIIKQPVLKEIPGWYDAPEFWRSVKATDPIYR